MILPFWTLHAFGSTEPEVLKVGFGYPSLPGMGVIPVNTGGVEISADKMDNVVLKMKKAVLKWDEEMSLLIKNQADGLPQKDDVNSDLPQILRLERSIRTILTIRCDKTLQ